MIRKLVLPALAAALLAGCVSDYAYRNDRGDYYYGQPRVEYRYDDGYWGYAPYGYGNYGNYGYGSYGYPYRYGAPYGYGGYYGPYYPPYYRPYHRHPRPPVTGPRPDGQPPQHRGDDRRPPWRNLDGLRRPPAGDGGTAAARPPREVVPDRPAAVEPRERGSRMEQTIRRANRSADRRPIEQEP